mmetsp:Transcript_19129/g.18259  ORF Transcript_19129/g.18259 Transcript_19129/m.18259 type:complete len:103 (-) Transcript_19129:20-328(-)
MQEYIKKEPSNFVFDAGTCFKAQTLLKHLGGEDQIDPQADGTDDQVGAFMMFIIRDSLKFMGLFPDKNLKVEVCQAWLLRMEEFKQDYYTKKSKELSAFLAQ